jgi:hypothetical protein
MKKQKFRLTHRAIMTVVYNQMMVSSELLYSYEGKPNQLYRLVKIIAEAQRAEPDDEKFRQFVIAGEKSWARWAFLAKEFRKWLQSTMYSYEYTSQERLGELFLEHLIRQRINHDHPQDFRPSSYRDK